MLHKTLPLKCFRHTAHYCCYIRYILIISIFIAKLDITLNICFNGCITAHIAIYEAFMIFKTTLKQHFSQQKSVRNQSGKPWHWAVLSVNEAKVTKAQRLCPLTLWAVSLQRPIPGEDLQWSSHRAPIGWHGRAAGLPATDESPPTVSTQHHNDIHHCSTMQSYKVLPIPQAHRVRLFFISLGLSQTPAYTARSQI